MSLTGRLYLDDVISSVPELGPTLSNRAEGSWLVLVGSMAIQMSVPSITAMYGVVLGYLTTDSPTALDLWKEEIALTPVLFIAFLNLADPWTRIIIKLATVPRLVGLIGVCLLSIGVLASGYLATGGVGAYLASVSAGAIMGIGGSFILVQTENIIRKSYQTHLRLVWTLKEVATSLGFIFAPGFVLALLSRSSLQIGLLLMTCSFIPTALGTIVLRSPVIRSRITSPYSLLISEEDNEMTNRVSQDEMNEMRMRDNIPRMMFTNEEEENRVEKGENSQRIGRDGSDIYSYYETSDDLQELFNVTWNEQLKILHSMKFWLSALASLGIQLGALFLWILLPSLAVVKLSSSSVTEGVVMTVIAGIGTLVPNVASYWKPSTARWRSFCFGGASWLGSFVLLALSTVDSFYFFILLAFLGGVSIGASTVCLESALIDALGNQSAKVAQAYLSLIVGLSILAFSFIPSPLVCLKLASLIQFVGGSYWVLVPIFGIIQAR